MPIDLRLAELSAAIFLKRVLELASLYVLPRKTETFPNRVELEP